MERYAEAAHRAVVTMLLAIKSILKQLRTQPDDKLQCRKNLEQNAQAASTELQVQLERAAVDAQAASAEVNGLRTQLKEERKAREQDASAAAYEIERIGTDLVKARWAYCHIAPLPAAAAVQPIVQNERLAAIAAQCSQDRDSAAPALNLRAFATKIDGN